MNKLTLDWAISITRCPDWPDERVAELAKRFSDGATPAQIIEAADTGLIPKGDAIWLLLQAGALPPKRLEAFCADLALRAVKSVGAVPKNFLMLPRSFDWLDDFSARLRTEAKALQQAGKTADAWRMMRASRIVGLYSQLFLYGADSVSRHAMIVEQASGIAYRCARDARAEQDAQFGCFRFLVLG